MDAPPSDRDRQAAGTAVTNDDTLPDHTGPLDSTPLRTLTFDQRYIQMTTLGQGGMGVVMSVRDEQIGREIAIKRLLRAKTGNPAVRARFQREARVQAQLEHPSIVPVYDLGVDANGDEWFTMKKVRGATLAEIVAGLRAGHTEMTAKHTQRRLLSAFSSVCLAIHFAHVRGIVHRDLKPHNVMLGEFGEVYVLDWGIAKIAGVSDAELSASSQRRNSAGPATEIGEVLGTVGYMPPEQLVDSAGVDARADVWALGAILFELLALEPLHPRMTLGEAIATSDEDRDARPSARAPHLAIDPELDAICVRATARAARDRFPTARALHDELARYLDGDLDRQRRREQANLHVERAREAERAAERGGDRALAQRTLAMQEINRALAIDPTNEQAKHSMVRMLVDAPSLPAAARDELRQSQAGENRLAFRVGALGFLSMYLFLPFYVWMGIRDWTLVGAVLGLIALSAGLLWWGGHAPGRARMALMLTIVSAGVLIALLTRVVGPFASAPVLAFGMAVGLAFNPSGTGMLGLLAFLGISLLAPTVAEFAGLVAPSYASAGGAIVVVPRMTELPPLATAVTLTLTSLSTITLAGLYLTRLHRLLQTTQERLFSYSWNVRQFLPELGTGA